MTFEKAREKVGISGQTTSLAIELMKADAMQRQVGVLERLASEFGSCLEKVSYIGKSGIILKEDK